MDLIHLLIKLGPKNICMFCFNECTDTFNIYINKEIEEDSLKETLNIASMINYLFPAFELILSQVCNPCKELLIKTYLIIKRNYQQKEILKNVINTVNGELNENEKLDVRDFEKGFSNVNLAKILNISNENSTNHKENFTEKITDHPENVIKIAIQNDIEMENKIENGFEYVPQQQCDICYKIFDNIKQYKLHLKTHQRKRKLRYYHCNECNYKTQCKKSIQGHKNKYHLRIRAYVCHLCSKSFYHRRNLVAHTKLHTDTQNDICEICGVIFPHKVNLLQHLKLHSGERPYECEICGKRFITSGRRLEHVKRIHMDKTICCQFCDKKFSLNKELTRHIKSVHSSLYCL